MKDVIARKLAGTRPAPPEDYRVPGIAGDLPRRLARLRPGRLTPAAVLVPIIERPEGLTILFTVRSEESNPVTPGPGRRPSGRRRRRSGCRQAT